MIDALKILLVFFLVFANGFFVAAEFSLVGVRRSRIQLLVEQGDRRAIRLMGLINNLNAYISATQLGITLASLSLGWVGEPAFAHLIELAVGNQMPPAALHIVSFGIAFSLITFLHIVLGELAPKTLALERAERTALAVALPLQIFYKVFAYPIRLLDWAGTKTVRLVGLHASGEHGASYTAEELRQLVDTSHRSGHIEEDEKQLIQRVFDFSDVEVREAMIPRTEVFALSVTASLEEAEQAFVASGFSRLPVYREQLDDVVGVLFLKELLPYLRLNRATSNGENVVPSFAIASTSSNGKTASDSSLQVKDSSQVTRSFAFDFNIESLLHPPMFIPGTARLGKVLTDMQAAQTHLAFVVDEHGGVEGIITLEDLLEEIVGEINDEYDDEVHAQVTQNADGSYTLDGTLAVRDANRHLGLKLPEDTDYTTLAGFLLAQAGRMLSPGETVDYDGATFTIESVEARRIRRIRFTPVTDAAVSPVANNANLLS